MSSENNSNYMGAFIGSLIGGIMLLVGEFAGWYYYDYYNGYREWGSVSAFSGPGFLLFGPLSGALLYVAYLSYNATKVEPPEDQLELMYKISRIVLITVIAGALLFIILAYDNDDWWFGEGFYGGAIGSLISVLLLNNARNES